MNREKNRLNRLKFWKKPTGSVRFQFYKPKTEKTKRTQTRKNRAKTRKNRAKTGLNRFLPKKTEPKPVLVFFFKKKLVWLFFLYKNRTELKMITPNNHIRIFYNVSIGVDDFIYC
jgi:hypothetical protein